MIEQSPRAVLVIQPKGFYANPETAADNAFQGTANGSADAVAAAAILEHGAFCESMRRNGIQVTALEGSGHPDEVFLNNWFSLHDEAGLDGHPRTFAVLYPMHHPSRRLERRQDIIDTLHAHCDEVIDLTPYEAQGKALEGTGSLVLDRVHKIAYAVLSERTDSEVLDAWATRLGYTPVTFDAILDGKPIYHTNVMMWIGSTVAGICLSAIPEDQRTRVRETLENSGHEILALTEEQVKNFAANAFEVTNADGQRLLMMSNRAFQSLTNDQKDILAGHYDGLEHVVHPTFANPELGGGSVRCAIAALHSAKGIDALVAALQTHGQAALLPEILEVRGTTTALGTAIVTSDAAATPAESARQRGK